MYCSSGVRHLRPQLLLALLGRRPWIVDVMVDSSRAGFELRRPGGVRGAANRSCTVDELLPLAPSMNSPISSEWSDDNAVQPPYGCNCAFYRARYFCAHLGQEGQEGYRRWIPRAESEGVCESVERAETSEAPFPPKFRVLFYGNSHLRQAVEGIMCKFSSFVERKRIRYTDGLNEGVQTVAGDVTCRHAADSALGDLVDHGCVSEEIAREAGSCQDDRGEFFMANGAVAHYHFAGGETEKAISDALPFHPDAAATPGHRWSYYDAVFANSGNAPAMSEASVLSSALELQEASVPFFWLSTFDGTGDIGDWRERDRSAFRDSGARYVNISAMALGLGSLTKGGVEDLRGSDGELDEHFCLPGPPDEMGLLLLKIMWAVRRGESSENFRGGGGGGGGGGGRGYSSSALLLMMFFPVAVVLLSFGCFARSVWSRRSSWVSGRGGRWTGRKAPAEPHHPESSASGGRAGLRSNS